MESKQAMETSEHRPFFLLLGLVQSLRRTPGVRELPKCIWSYSYVLLEWYEVTVRPTSRAAVLVRTFPYLWVKHTRFASFPDHATENYSDIPGFVSPILRMVGIEEDTFKGFFNA